MGRAYHARRGFDFFIMNNYKLKEFTLNILADIVGAFALAIGIYCFSEKVNIAPGGVSGVSIMIKYLTGAPVGLLSAVINIPLVILAYRLIGKRFALRTVRTIVICSAVLDLIVSRYFPQYSGDRMLGAVFAGVFMGIGLGTIFLRGSTTGGTDIISCLTERRFPHIQIGKALMLIDGVVLAASVVVFKNIESGMFGIVALFCQTRIIDGIVYGVDKGKNILIVSEKNKRIAELILERMERGATFLKAEGAYFGKDMKVLMCVVRAPEYHVLREIVYNEDPRAFIIVSDVSQIMGEGFAPVKLSKMG